MSLKVDTLMAARDAYLDNLSRRIAPILHEAFKTCAREVLKEIDAEEKRSPQKKSASYAAKLYALQKEFDQVPEWGRSRINDITQQVVERCSWMRKVVRMIFGSHVVILTCVNHKPEDVTLDLPTDQDIVHSFLVEAARLLNDAPWLLIPEKSQGATPQQLKREKVQRNAEITRLMHDAIDDAIKKMVPFETLADQFLAGTFCAEVDTGAAKPTTDQAAAATGGNEVNAPADATEADNHPVAALQPGDAASQHDHGSVSGDSRAESPQLARSRKAFKHARVHPEPAPPTVRGEPRAVGTRGTAHSRPERAPESQRQVRRRRQSATEPVSPRIYNRAPSTSGLKIRAAQRTAVPQTVGSRQRGGRSHRAAHHPRQHGGGFEDDRYAVHRKFVAEPTDEPESSEEEVYSGTEAYDDLTKDSGAWSRSDRLSYESEQYDDLM